MATEAAFVCGCNSCGVGDEGSDGGGRRSTAGGTWIFRKKERGEKKSKGSSCEEQRTVLPTQARRWDGPRTRGRSGATAENTIISVKKGLPNPGGHGQKNNDLIALSLFLFLKVVMRRILANLFNDEPCRRFGALRTATALARAKLYTDSKEVIFISCMASFTLLISSCATMHVTFCVFRWMLSGLGWATPVLLSQPCPHSSRQYAPFIVVSNLRWYLVTVFMHRDQTQELFKRARDDYYGVGNATIPSGMTTIGDAAAASQVTGTATFEDDAQQHVLEPLMKHLRHLLDSETSLYLRCKLAEALLLFIAAGAADAVSASKFCQKLSQGTVKKTGHRS